MNDATAEQKANALVNRGVAKERLPQPDVQDAIADFDAVLAMNDAPAEQKANALFNRGVTKGQLPQPDVQGAIADYDAVLAMTDATTEQKANALFNLGCTKSLQDNASAAVSYLRRWQEADPLACQEKLDQDLDFDAIRDDPAFIEFRTSLPQTR